MSKHVTVLGELSRLVAARNLLEVSEIEQQIACDGEHSQCLTAIRKLVVHEQTTDLVSGIVDMWKSMLLKMHISHLAVVTVILFPVNVVTYNCFLYRFLIGVPCISCHESLPFRFNGRQPKD